MTKDEKGERTMENINAFKAFLSASVAALTSLWGWFGWLVIGWISCMLIDYITGSAAAIRKGQWSSDMARDGIWHKIGCAMAVIASGIMDLVIGLLIDNMPGVVLPFDYHVFFCALVVVWYILTEIGSIIENAGELGAPVPEWLKNAIGKLKDQVDDSVNVNGMNKEESESKE